MAFGVARTAGALILALACGLADRHARQSTSPSKGDVETDSDPTRPVFVSVRPEFYNFDRRDTQLLIVRYDTAFRRILILRFEVPAARSDFGEHAASGLGDAYGQFLLVPIQVRAIRGRGRQRPRPADRDRRTPRRRQMGADADRGAAVAVPTRPRLPEAPELHVCGRLGQPSISQLSPGHTDLHPRGRWRVVGAGRHRDEDELAGGRTDRGEIRSADRTSHHERGRAVGET